VSPCLSGLIRIYGLAQSHTLRHRSGLVFSPATTRLESTDLWGHPLMPPNWFLQLGRGQGGRGGISQGLRFWRQLREIPERYCGVQWRRPVQKGPVLAEWYESRSRMIAKQDWA